MSLQLLTYDYDLVIAYFTVWAKLSLHFCSIHYSNVETFGTPVELMDGDGAVVISATIPNDAALQVVPMDNPHNTSPDINYLTKMLVQNCKKWSKHISPENVQNPCPWSQDT